MYGVFSQPWLLPGFAQNMSLFDLTGIGAHATIAVIIDTGVIRVDSLIQVPDEKAPNLMPPRQVAPGTMDVHLSSSMMVAVTKPAVSLPKARHYHDSYEFVVPLEVLQLYVGRKAVDVPDYRLLAFNPDQLHGPSRSGDMRFLAIMLTRGLMGDIADSVGFYTDVEFRDELSVADHRLRSLMSTFVSESKGQQIGYQAILESLATEITVNLIRSLPGNLDPYRFDKKVPYHSKVQLALEYIEANFDQEFSLAELAALCDASAYHLIRLFKQHTGLTPHSYITRFRIDRARKMLMRKDLSITEVCFSSGFTSPSHFSAVFRQITGMSPSGFRKLTM